MKKTIKDLIAKIQPKVAQFSNKEEMNDFINLSTLTDKQLQDAFVNNEIDVNVYNKTMILFSSSLIKHGFFVEGINALENITPDYFKEQVLKDMESDKELRAKIVEVSTFINNISFNYADTTIDDANNIFNIQYQKDKLNV